MQFLFKVEAVISMFPPTPLLNCTGVFGLEAFPESLEIASASGGSHPSGNSNLSSEKTRSA